MSMNDLKPNVSLISLLTFPNKSTNFHFQNLNCYLMFISVIKTTDVDDVREVLSYYRQHSDPIDVFRENQRKLKEEIVQLEEQQKKELKTNLFSNSLSFMRKR